MPHLAEDDGDGAQLHVQDAVAEAGVQRYQEADGCAEELDGSDDELFGQLDDADVPFLELGVEPPVAGLVAQFAGLVDEELGGVALVSDDDGDDEYEGLDYAG